MQRASVQESLYPIALRQEHTTEFERLLYLQPRYDPKSSSEFTVKYDSNDSTLFTITGKKYSERRVREFRDASGLPLFEYERLWPTWTGKKQWRVSLPGNVSEDLVNIKMRSVRYQEFDVTFPNALAKVSKAEDQKMVTLQVRKQCAVLGSFVVLLDNRVVVDIRESMQRNKRLVNLLHVSGSRASQWVPSRAVLEILVADGVDLALVSFCIMV